MPRSVLLLYLGILSAFCWGAVAQNCPIGGSTHFCGVVNGTVSGPYTSACTCTSSFCCSQSGFCGPEPTIPGTGAFAEYCGDGCQAAYGNCSPGRSFFEYIGTGDATPDTVNTNATISNIPVPPSGATLFFIVFLLSDQYTQRASGSSTGNFGPVGLFAEGSTSPPTWVAAKIQQLASRGSNTKVMASVGGDKNVTVWAGVPNVTAYVEAALASLRSYRSQFGLAGFDIDYEEGINGNQKEQWVQAWCEIISNLKQDGALITLAPFKDTNDTYLALQKCLSDERNTNIDFIIYQTYAEADANTSTLTDALTNAQKTFAPTKIIAGFANEQLESNSNLTREVYAPLLASGNIIGASVFDADISSTRSPPFILERALWG